MTTSEHRRRTQSRAPEPVIEPKTEQVAYNVNEVEEDDNMTNGVDDDDQDNDNDDDEDDNDVYFQGGPFDLLRNFKSHAVKYGRLTLSQMMRHVGTF